MKPLRLLLLGAPGSGKGTQTSKILKDFTHIRAISSGDILRQQINAQTIVGRELSRYIESGSLVPDEIMARLVETELQRRQWLNRDASWLLDGFPRTYDQASILDKVLGKSGATLNQVVELDVDQNVILQRIEARWIHLPSGRVYNLDYNPPKVPFKDDVTGEPLLKRSDDNAETFQKRLDIYNREIGPLRDYYKQKNIFHTISGNSSDIIYPQLSRFLLKKFAS